MFFLYLLRLISTGSSTILSVLGHITAMQHFKQGLLISFCLCLDLFIKSIFFLNSTKILSKTNSYRASVKINVISVVATILLAIFSYYFSIIIGKGYDDQHSLILIGMHLPIDVLSYLGITLALSLYGSMNALSNVSMDLLSSRFSRNTKVNVSSIQAWVMRIDSISLATCLLVVAFFQFSSVVAFLFASAMHVLGILIAIKNKKKLLATNYQDGTSKISVRESLKLSFSKMKSKEVKLLAFFSFIAAYASSLLWVGMIFLVLLTIHNQDTPQQNLLWLRIFFSVAMIAVITVISRKVDNINDKIRNFVMIFSASLACIVLYLVYQYRFQYSFWIIFAASLVLFIGITTFRFVQKSQRQKLMNDEEYFKTASFFVSLETLGHMCASFTVGILGENSTMLFIVLLIVSILYLIYHKYSTALSRYYKIFLPKL